MSVAEERQAEAISPDLEQMAEYFSALHGTATPDDGRVALYREADKTTQFHSVEHPEALARLLAIMSRTHDAFVTINLFDPRHEQAIKRRKGRGKESEVLSIIALVADIDAAKTTSDANYPPHEKVMAALRLMPLRPSLVIASGNPNGGVHAYWLLHEPHRIRDEADRARVKRASKLWQKSIEQKLSPYKMDGTADLVRVLRAAGNVHHKHGTLTKPIIFEPHTRYELGDFEEFLPEDSIEDRERLAKVPLPPRARQSRKLMQSFNELLFACGNTKEGGRSEADWALIKFAIAKGLTSAEVWGQVENVGKFAEGGERYFLRTWERAEQAVREAEYVRLERKTAKGKAPSSDDSAEPDGETTDVEPITNAIVDFTGEEPVTIALPMGEVLRRIEAGTSAWPRRVDTSPFVHDAEHGVAWIPSPSAMFGWLANRVGTIEWHKTRGCVTKEETFAEVCRVSQRYLSVEKFPHEPLLADHYYACPEIEPGDGSTLAKFLDRFSPATDIDRDLIQALMMTLVWGGPGGCRPAFPIDSDDGRGAGKSKLAEMVTQLVGGALEFDGGDDIEQIKSRMLSPEALTKRVAVWDNLKSYRFSCAALEALITTPTISGKRMYVGEGSRPNTLTYILTLNAASLSTDLAQRSCIIKLKAPPRSDTWEEDTRRFVEEHRAAIIGDLIGCLRAEPYQLAKFTRWASWERAVLSRLPEPGEAQRVILERQGTADVESEEAELIEEFFAARLQGLGYDARQDVVHIPSEVACEWFNLAMNERQKVAAVSRILNQLSNERRLKRIGPNKCKTYGRGVLWTGDEAGLSMHTKIDLRERITEARRRGS